MFREVKNAAKLAALGSAGFAGFTSFLGFPDRDISLLGIGSHRFFLFHSGAAIAALHHMYQRWYTLGDNSATERVLKKVSGVALGGAAIGVGVHLLSDVIHPKSVVFPFLGSLIDGTMFDDTIWLFGNAVWCFKIGADVIMLAAGDDVVRLKELIQNQLAEVNQQWLPTR